MEDLEENIFEKFPEQRKYITSTSSVIKHITNSIKKPEHGRIKKLVDIKTTTQHWFLNSAIDRKLEALCGVA